MSFAPRVLAAAVAATCSLAIAAPLTPQQLRALLPNPHHQAIFCGVDGGEGSRAYSEALSKALDEILKRGAAKNAGDAIALLKGAVCPPATTPAAKP